MDKENKPLKVVTELVVSFMLALSVLYAVWWLLFNERFL